MFHRLVSVPAMSVNSIYAYVTPVLEWSQTRGLDELVVLWFVNVYINFGNLRNCITSSIPKTRRYPNLLLLKTRRHFHSDSQLSSLLLSVSLLSMLLHQYKKFVEGHLNPRGPMLNNGSAISSILGRHGHHLMWLRAGEVRNTVALPLFTPTSQVIATWVGVAPLNATDSGMVSNKPIHNTTPSDIPWTIMRFSSSGAVIHTLQLSLSPMRRKYSVNYTFSVP